MSEREAGHLPPAQIIEAAEGVLSHAAAKLHLNACEVCRGRVELWQAGAGELAVLRARPQSGTTGGCPSMEDLANYSAGAADEKSGELLDHLVQCGRCAAIMTDALDSSEPEVTPALRSSGGAWQREMAATFARKPKRSAVSYWRYAGIAAAVVIVSGAALWWKEHGAADPAMLLAKAYTEARPFEYRLADQGYGPIRQERGSGSAFNRPQSLASAETEIQRRLAMRADDPELLALKGRAQLLEWDYEGAIESLSRASESKPDDPELLSDLGTAYAVRGETEEHNIDYGHALDLFLRALKKQPTNQRDLFNLALTYEHLRLVDEALDTWTKLLRSKPAEGWRREAEVHLSALEKTRQERKKAEDDVVKDPAAFLAKTQTQLDFDPELYHDIFWTKWLPAINSDPAARLATRLEARAFQRRFQDRYLMDIVSAAGAKAGMQGIADLTAAVALNRSGQTDRAAVAARKAAAELHAFGVAAGELRAQVELAYSYRRASMNQECLQLTELVLRGANSRSYAWLTGQAHLEHASCAERLSNSGAARAEVSEARRALELTGLRLLALRASGFVAGVDEMSGNDAPVWENGPAGLKTYWTFAASPLRAQDFQFDMQSSARALRWEEAAIALERASIHSLEQVGNPEMEALNRIYLANLLKENKDYSGAALEFEKAQRLFHSIGPGPTLENLTWLARLGRCEAAVVAGHAPEALKELEDLGVNVGSRSSLDQMRVQQIRGLALAAVGDWRRAIEAFELAVGWNQRKVASLGSYLERVPVLESAAPSYRNLAEIQLIRLHDSERSLATWLLYQGEPDGHKTLPSAAARGGSVTLIYGVLPSGIAVWSARGTAVTARLVDAPASEVEIACRRFLRLCSSPASPGAEIGKVGNRLYRWLIAPELDRHPEEQLYLRTDSWLASIPFAALSDNSGRYLGRSHAFIDLAGPERAASPADRAITPDSPALVVSAPSGEAPGQKSLALLRSAELEATEVSGYFGKPTILMGSAVSPESIASWSGRSTIFHFCGHGWANGGDGALILPPTADGNPRFETSREIARQDWRQCSLAVLSACLTAAGEERGAVNNQSLVRALVQAGARQVIAARWSVDSEATRALMGRFYSRLLSGKRVAESLGGAASVVAASAGWSHPYYWAGFEVFSTVREP